MGLEILSTSALGSRFFFWFPVSPSRMRLTKREAFYRGAWLSFESLLAILLKDGLLGIWIFSSFPNSLVMRGLTLLAITLET